LQLGSAAGKRSDIVFRKPIRCPSFSAPRSCVLGRLWWRQALGFGQHRAVGKRGQETLSSWKARPGNAQILFSDFSQRALFWAPARWGMVGAYAVSGPLSFGGGRARQATAAPAFRRFQSLGSHLSRFLFDHSMVCRAFYGVRLFRRIAPIPYLAR
jgi:hypothetical protein